MRVTTRFVAPLIGLLVVACGTGEGGADNTSTSLPEPTTSTTNAGSNPSTTTTIGDNGMPDQDEIVEAAQEDLGRRKGVPVEAVSVVRVRAVDWPDASLGCPEEGMVYSQVVTPGFQVVLQVEDRVFDYHAGSDGAVFLCPSEERDGGYDFVPPPGIDT